jgi:hypothetical protein
LSLHIAMQIRMDWQLLWLADSAAASVADDFPLEHAARQIDATRIVTIELTSFRMGLYPVTSHRSVNQIHRARRMESVPS